MSGAVELDPKSSRFAATLAAMTHRLGRPVDAIPLYERALALDPDSESVLFNLGVAHLDGGQADETAAVLARLRELGSARADALEARASR